MTDTASARSLVDLIRSKLTAPDQESLALDEAVDTDLLELSESDVEVVCDALPMMARGKNRTDSTHTLLHLSRAHIKRYLAIVSFHVHVFDRFRIRTFSGRLHSQQAQHLRPRESGPMR